MLANLQTRLFDALLDPSLPSLIHTAHLAITLQSQSILTRIAGRRTPLTSSIGGTSDFLGRKVVGADDPRCALAELMGREFALVNQPPHRGLAHLQNRGRFVERQLASLGPFTLSVGRDPAVIAQHAHA